jgi:TonB family protein
MVPPSETQPPVPKSVPEARVGAFSSDSSVEATSNLPARKVQTGGFGSPGGVLAEAQGGNARNVARLGAFNLPAGLGDGNGSGGAHGARGAVASAAFDNDIAGAAENKSASGQVRPAGFADAQSLTSAAAQPNPREAPASFQPVEIAFKPNPVYTEEARRLRIQGAVILQVVFGASGELHVLRVVSGLGYGLDEAALRAAERIRFKPARRNGQPVDTIATLHMFFQQVD